MIFVTLGTQDKEFPRLIEEIDRLIENKTIKEEVIVQAGCTKYESKNLKILDLISHDEFEKLVSECSLLITHGGVGSILTGIKRGKIVIAVPRLKKYKEHESDHQIQIINEFNKKGYIIGLKGVEDLESALKKAKVFKPNEFRSNNSIFINKIEDYIEEEEKKKQDLKINKTILMGTFLFAFNIVLRLLLETHLLTKHGDELLSLIITWIVTSLLYFILNPSKKTIYITCKNSIWLLIEYILVLLFVVLIGIKSLWLKAIIYILTLIISYISGYIINLVFINRK